jgi:inosine-uridine nucleoside N-ribohydrolase
MVDLVMANPGELTIVATGPMTNLALAFKLEPRLAQNVARLVLMGGAFTGPGGMRELNFAYDPEAAHIVLTSGAPATLIPLDVTRTTLLTLDDNRRLLSSRDPVARLLGSTAEPWIRWLGAVRGAPGCHLHDPLAMAVAIDPSLVDTESMHLAIELHGAHTRSRPTRWLADGRDLATDPDRAGGPIDVAHTVDADRFLTFLLDLLS